MSNDAAMAISHRCRTCGDVMPAADVRSHQRHCHLSTIEPIKAVPRNQMCANFSGICPVEYKCLIFPEVVEEVTAGGIVLAQSTVEAEQTAEVRATLIAIGGMAFADWKDERKPQPGDKVMVAKYSGVLCKGKDKQEYRLVNDKDILAILE